MQFSNHEVSIFTASELAGFSASYALWSMAENEQLVPMLVYMTDSDEIKVDCIEPIDSQQDPIEYGLQKLRSNDFAAKYASFVYATHINIDKTRTRAIIIEIRCYSLPKSEAVVSIPYSPKSNGKFCIHAPQITRFEHCEDSWRQQFLYSFIDGIEGNELGQNVWNTYFDMPH
jgi:hypothetical protein